MGLFERLSVSFGFNKKSDIAFLPSSEAPVSITKNSVKCASYPYKTLASFDLNMEKPKYEGAIPEATIKFYPID